MSRHSKTMRAASLGAIQGFKTLERELMRVRPLSPSTRARMERNERQGVKATITRKLHHG